MDGGHPHAVGVERDLVQARERGRRREHLLRHLDQRHLHRIAQEERSSQVLAFSEVVTQPGDEKERPIGLGQLVRRPGRSKE